MATDYFFTISRDMFERNREHPKKKTGDDEKSHAPRLAIQCKDIFVGEIDGFKDAAPCLEISLASQRKVVKGGLGQIDGDEHVSFDDVIICMKYGSWGPRLNGALIEGHKIPKIEIRRFVILKKIIVVIQETVLENCTVTHYAQDSGLIVFSINFVRGMDTHIHYDDKGLKKGVTSMEFDTTTMKVVSK